ncbi:MAG: copper chaperone PCu(A)C [Alphaproteobacteria bacterium]
MIARWAVLGLAVAIAASSKGGTGQNVAAGDISVSGAWARATIGAADTGAAYVTISNRGSADDALIGASSSASAAVELHEMNMSDGVMRMRATSRAAIPAGATVSFSPGGSHLMLIGLKEPLKAGGRVSLTLAFERARAITVQADIR